MSSENPYLDFFSGALDGYYNVQSAKQTAKVAAQVNKPNGYGESIPPSVPVDRPVSLIGGMSNTQLWVISALAVGAVMYAVSR